MSNISEKINAIYQTVAEDEPRRDIAPEYVYEAICVLKSYKVNDTNGLFYYLSAISLLNAAIKIKAYKTPEFRKKGLNYSFIKGKARVIVEFVIAKKVFDSVSYYYNRTESCLYVKVHDVVFSFHRVEETDFILDVAANATPFTWSGIKLQWIAEDVYLLAKELVV